MEQLDHLIEQRISPASRAATVSGFTRALYHDVAPSDLVSERPEHLYAAAVSLFAFMDQRDPGELKIRVFNPDLDEHGWQSSHTVVELINDDMPFLVDSVCSELNRLDAEVRLLIHPLFTVERAEDGSLSSVRGAGASADQSESLIHIRVRAQPEARHDELLQALIRVLSDVRAAVEDYDSMRDRCASVIADVESKRLSMPPSSGLSTGDANLATVDAEPLSRRDIEDRVEEDRREVVEFLKWLNQDDFAYFGYRYSRVSEGAPPSDRHGASAGLGILRDPMRSVFEGLQAPTTARLLRIFKANKRSSIHRPVHMDVVVVADIDDTGVLRGSHMFVGLFTLAAYSRSPLNIPLLRHKVRRVLERAGYPVGSHNSKVLKYILETYPRDELFQVSEDTLAEITSGILHLEYRPKVALFARRDSFGRFVSCLLYVPRDRYDTNLRQRLQKILTTAYSGTVSAFYPSLGDSPLARLHLIIKTPAGVDEEVDHAALERRLFEATYSWQDRLETALINEQGEEHGSATAREYRYSFGASYREEFDEVTAVSDIEYVEHTRQTGQVGMHLYRPVEAQPHELSFKVFSKHYVMLSDVLPMLENMGLHVAGEVPYELHPGKLSEDEAAPEIIWMHDFQLVTENEVPIELNHVKESFIEVFGLVWHGEMDSDGFNKLVLHAGLRANQVKAIRAYARYLRQGGLPYSLDYIQSTLLDNADVASSLMTLFSARLDPEIASDENAAKIQNAIVQRLDSVQSLDKDRILRALLNTVMATTRTNFYQCDDRGACKTHLSFKFDSQRLEELPRPRPEREIFVFGPRVEGVHLRFGAVARGGLRWSDRLEDYRTEVLGLVKAQQVKNAVIVPVGSKGGFVVRRPPPPGASRDAAVAEGIACYKHFISGLLDVTDNLRGDTVIPPEHVRRHDGDDPYLVVAADKGTATFSDIANEIAQSRQFWLDDAFASGGSVGYDHKKMGITARGAWESVKRHFRELGKDIQSQAFTCVAVGDMSGDVFGNGMLLSKHTRLIAAFNHLHVFIDPNPDAAKSWAERKRLFDMPRSSWADYDPDLISEGGGVFPRDAKKVEISTQVQQLLGLSQASLAPNELIQAILKTEVELLFFGGIGTYVKAHSESDADVGDRSNDSLRINGSQLRAKVVGEGANLGMTQRARIEYSLIGGLCNTDFIDNCAGVDCSDHEVNIKIALGAVVDAGDMTEKQRNKLLEQMTDEVASLVLRDAYEQTQSLSVTQQLGAYLTDRIARYMRALEKTGGLDRSLEFLPDEETLKDRQQRRLGFTRPELCVLLSYAKNDLFRKLVASPRLEDPYLTKDLFAYFPEPLREPHAQVIEHHRLRKEIIATVLSNELVNRAGLTFMYEVCERSNLGAGDAILAYVTAREILQLKQLWHRIEQLDNQVAAAQQANMLAEVGRWLSATTTWLLTQCPARDIGPQLEIFAEPARQLVQHLDVSLSDADKQSLAAREQAYTEGGVPQELAHEVARLPVLVSICDLVTIANQTDRELATVARLYFEVGSFFGFEWLRDAARKLHAGRAWDKQAVAGITDDLYSGQKAVTLAILNDNQTADANNGAISAWCDAHPQHKRVRRVLNELRASPRPDLPMLTVAARHLGSLASAR